MIAALDITIGVPLRVMWLAFLGAPITWTALSVWVACAGLCSHHWLEGHTNRAWAFGCSSAIAFVAMLLAGGA